MSNYSGKIGIITMYYKSHNYGGLLQSYALQKILEKEGYDSEQICYRRDSIYSIKGKCKKMVKMMCLGLLSIKHFSFFRDLRITRKIEYRFKSMEYFGEHCIRHSEEVYGDEQLNDTNSKYDMFITGSDQVWANNISAYFLDFVKNKRKISYAASIAKSELSEQEKRHFSDALTTYYKVSVREKDSIRLLSECSNKHIELVLDPVLLLDAEEWDRISSKRLYEKNYIFCYFLGNSIAQRSLVKEFATLTGLPICAIPHLQGTVERADICFADSDFIDASPSDFVSLIKYADFVFTDSFHVSAFSCIYNKNMVVFNREGSRNMSSRIKTLLDIFHCQDRYCELVNEISIDDIQQKLLTGYYDLDFLDLKEASKDFLFSSVKQ